MVRRSNSAEKDLIKLINKLEKQKDKKQIWRNQVNLELNRNYKNF